MTRLIILLCLTLGIVMTGCGGDDKGKDDKGGDKGTAADKAASSSKDTTDKGDGSGDKKDAKPAEKDAKPGDGASVEKSGDMQTVSLKLPNMT